LIKRKVLIKINTTRSAANAVVEGSGSSVGENFVLLDKAKGKAYVADTFEEIKNTLSELTEHDLEITNKEWEKIQLLTPGDLPFEVGIYRLCEESFEFI